MLLWVYEIVIFLTIMLFWVYEIMKFLAIMLLWVYEIMFPIAKLCPLKICSTSFFFGILSNKYTKKKHLLV